MPKAAWRWVDTARYKLTQRGRHRAAGVVDLVVCATAAHHGHYFSTVAGVVTDLRQRDIRHRVRRLTAVRATPSRPFG